MEASSKSLAQLSGRILILSLPYNARGNITAALSPSGTTLTPLNMLPPHHPDVEGHGIMTFAVARTAALGAIGQMYGIFYNICAA